MDRARPTGISILSVWQMISGLGGLLLSIPFLAKQLHTSPDTVATLSAVGIPPISIPLLAPIVSVAVVVSGIGMWRGYIWGWYISCFYYFYFVLKSINNNLGNVPMWNIYFKENIPDELMDGVILQFIKIGIVFIIPLVIYIYFYRRAVKEYFDATDVSNLSVILKHIGIFFAFSIIYGLSI